MQSDPIGLNGGISTYQYANSNSIRNSDPHGLVTFFGQLGGSYVLGGGVEGGAGVYINTTDVDAGVFANGGRGGGLNIGVSGQLGIVKGDVNNFRGEFQDFNWSFGPFSGTNFYSGGEYQGSSIGITPPGGGLPIGASATVSDTVATGIQDLIAWLRDRKSEPGPSSACKIRK